VNPADSGLAIIVVSWNSWATLPACLQSVEADIGDRRAELIVVDSASTDETRRELPQQFPRWRLISLDVNLGYAGANNVGYAASASDFVLLLNPDTVLEPGCISRLEACLRDSPRTGAVGPLKLNSDGSIQPSWGRFPNLQEELMRQTRLYRLLPVASPLGRRFTWRQPALLPHGQEMVVDWVTGSAILVRRKAAGTSLFREGNYMYREDCDLCHRISSAGLEVRFLPSARMVHLMWASAGQDPGRVIRLRLRGETLYFQYNGSRVQQVGSCLMTLIGSMARAILLLLASALSRSAARHAKRAAARGFLGAARDCLGLLTGFIDKDQLAAARVA
jgi:GT2 family glycosyltransferase